MVSQQNVNVLLPILSFVLFTLPSSVYNDQLNTYPNNYNQQQQQQAVAQPDSSLSPSEISYDTKNFEQDSEPAAFNWDTPGVSNYSIEIILALQLLSSSPL